MLSQEAQLDLLAPDILSENFPSLAEAGLYDGTFAIISVQLRLSMLTTKLFVW